MQQRRIQLGAEVVSRQRIYLDQRFWLLFRDASLSNCREDSVAELLAYLRASVEEGISICPISESVFIELLKQSDDSTRIATAQLVDELSRGVTLIPFDERVQQELCNSFYTYAGATELTPISELVWTKLSYIFGEILPYNTPFQPEEELAVQKAFADHMWDISLCEMVERLGVPPTLGGDWESIAIRLNDKNRTHFPMLRSYPQTFKIEFEGGAESISRCAG